MKKGSWLVNNARGAICDPPAVVEALKSGHLRGLPHTCSASVSAPKHEHSLLATADTQRTPSYAFRMHQWGCIHICCSTDAADRGRHDDSGFRL